MKKFTIGLDLSTKCSGYSVFQGKDLIEQGRVKPKTTLSTLNKIKYITSELNLIFKKYKDVDKIIIEDIFLGNFKGKGQVKGFATLGRLSGAVMETVWKELDLDPDIFIELIGAVQARPLVGLKGNCQKVEVQIWVLDKFTNTDISDYQGLVDAIKAKKEVKDIDQKEYKKRMLQVSKLIDKECLIGEDNADAILLAYGGGVC